MNISEYPKPQTVFAQLHSANSESGGGSCGNSWRGFLTRATLLAIGLGGYFFLAKKIDFADNGRRFFYALRRYFPHDSSAATATDRDDASKDDGVARRNGIKHHSSTTRRGVEVCPVCLGNSKTGVRASCGHFLCARCLARYCEVRRTKSPPCPMCRAPLNSVTLASDLAWIEGREVPVLTELDVAGLIGDWVEDNDERQNAGQDDVVDGDDVDERDAGSRNFSCEFASWCEGHFSYRNFILWIIVVLALITAKFQVLPWGKWIVYGSMLDFVMALAVMPAIYIWCMYRARAWTIRYE